MSELFQSNLVEAYLNAKSKNPAFSKRAFAKRLGVSSGALTEFLSGKRNPSKGSLAKILERLHIEPAVKEEILQDSPKLSQGIFQDLESKHYEILSDWVHLALLSLINTQGFRYNPSQISERLAVSEGRIRSAWERLLKVQLIEDKNGQFVRTKKSLQTSENIRSLAIQNYHSSLLEKSREVLQKTPVNERDFCALTFPFAKEDLPWLQKEVRKFTDKVIKKSKTKKHKDVFQFNSQIYCLTEGAEKDKSK